MAPATSRGGVEQGNDFLGFSPFSKSGEKKNTPKRKRMNRNKKKTWKKHIDVRDVEEFMDDVRLQERTVGGLLSERPNENLFFVDTNKKKKDSRILPATRKLRKRTRPLKIDLILQPDSKVPPPKDILSHQVPNAKKLKRKREREEQQLETKGILPRTDRLLLAQQDRPSSTHKDEPNNNPTRGFYDLWAAKNPLDSAFEGKEQWFLEQTKKGRVKRPERMNKKPSVLPAVEVAAPGASYNPSYESHQDLLLKAHEVEVKKLKEEKKLERQVKCPTRDEAPTEETRLRELCEGLVEESEEEGSGPGAQDGELKATSLHQRERKTERQRKKDKEAKFLRARQEAEKTERLRRQGLFQLKSIQTSLKSRQDELLRRKKLREKTQKAKALQPKRLGRLKYQEPDVDVLLSEELTESLRKLKPQGNVTKDRFKSFQKRNLIEPRERAKFKRKLKVKYVEKRAFREISA
ncbi:ribosome biogenesis protein NOP53 [Bufo gargarizans]|uniref:ribosome biogenesis protein NOP53 n=1 Tax=Bufo gargarizans TaxID=30331 RepID=UPI001CF56D9C|nr:ribosome biogenesis protein NOP53 [Bufo gargarizans]